MIFQTKQLKDRTVFVYNSDPDRKVAQNDLELRVPLLVVVV